MPRQRSASGRATTRRQLLFDRALHAGSFTALEATSLSYGVCDAAIHLRDWKQASKAAEQALICASQADSAEAADIRETVKARSEDCLREARLSVEALAAAAATAAWSVTSPATIPRASALGLALT